MEAPAPIGHNNPPDAIEDTVAPFGDILSETDNWLDGERVTTEAQMLAVDALIKGVKAARKAVDEARDAETAPLHVAWKCAIARWQPTQDDLDMRIRGLVGLVDSFKRQLAAAKTLARQQAESAAWAAMRAAEEATRKADVTNLEAQYAAKEAMRVAEAAQEQAAAAAKDNVKGMRNVTRYEVTDHRALLKYIAANARDDITAFIDEWARKNHKKYRDADGLRVWTAKEAY